MARAEAKGPELEARVARLLYWEGALARRRVNLEASFGERFSITDVDVMTFEFSPTLELHIRVGECKATEAKGAPSAGDRLLWLAGLVRLVGAHGGFLATSRAAGPRVRELAAGLGLEIVDGRDLERREALFGLGPTDGYGPHDAVIRAVEARAFGVSKRDEDLRRVYWFVRSDLWLLPPIGAVKKAMGGLRLVGSRWSDGLPADERETLRWLAAELTVGFCLAVVRLAGKAYRQPEEVFAEDLLHRLSEGVASFEAMQEISRSVDRVLMGAMRDLGLDPSRGVRFLGAFEPQPPGYAEPLAEVVQRLATSRQGAADLCRVADAVFTEDFGVADWPKPAIGSTAESLRLLRLVGAFLERQARVPDSLLAPILKHPSNGLPNGASLHAHAPQTGVAAPTLFGPDAGTEADPTETPTT